MYGWEIRYLFEMWGNCNGVFQGVYPADGIPVLAALDVNADVCRRMFLDFPAYFDRTNIFGGDGKNLITIYPENDRLKFAFEAQGRRLAAIIVNTDVFGGGGKHWVAIFLENDRLEFFDSFGRSPEYCHNGSFHISNFFKKYPNRIHNSFKFQCDESLFCGYYCIYFIFQRFIGSDWNYTLGNLWKQENRDKFVKDFVENLKLQHLLIREFLKKATK
ncbi:hypothetical protein AVEN_11331-1 [Araneus ventricosus]|uniref:Ubiquitin-like protease family profile domain-containing protein n=1 Tax=Araneus ventricosus TaxID=182803 RepID=A0A4Y2PFA7_ARAVE|nr:hypothetical protein AVEN_11331-1 [Araneus ventricosus]